MSAGHGCVVSVVSRLRPCYWQFRAARSCAGLRFVDSMSPGDITQLWASDEVAFRVHSTRPRNSRQALLARTRE